MVVFDGPRHAFITGPDGMGMRDLGTLSGSGESFAGGINDAGQVVGVNSATAEGSRHAFITGPDGMGMRDLGTLGGSESLAGGINNAGQVVGSSDTAEGSRHAFITGPDGAGMMDLNSLSLVGLPAGVVLQSASGINNAGQVIATAIPEPEVYALFFQAWPLSALSRGEKRWMQGALPAITLYGSNTSICCNGTCLVSHRAWRARKSR